MKTFLLIVFAAAFTLVVIRLFPIVLASAGLGAAVLLALLGFACLVMLPVAAGALGVVAALVTVLALAVAAMSPIWIPILAVIGLISLIRRRSKTV